MKFTSILSCIATVAVVATATGLAFNALALGLFAASASSLVLLIASGDYARRPGYADLPMHVRVTRAENMPLAA